MKKIIVVIAAIVMIAGFTSKVSAQVNTASTPAAAKIVTPIQIALDGTNNKLNFGVMTNTVGGDVTVSTSGTASSSTVVLLSSATPAAMAPSYTVSGTGGYTYSITLPTNGTITVTGGTGPAMPVKDFVSSIGLTGTLPTPAGTTTTQTFSVGATLTVATGQGGGTYTGSFPVVVNYN